MYQTLNIIPRSQLSQTNKSVYFTHSKITISPPKFEKRTSLKQQNIFNQILSQATSLTKISHGKANKKSRVEDPLMKHNPPILGKAPPAIFKQFLDGEVNLDQMLKSQVNKNESSILKDQNVMKKSKLKRERTIFLRNQNVDENLRKQKLEKLQKFIEQKILKKVDSGNHQIKRPEIVDIIQEQRRIHISSNIKKFKQMQIHYIPKSQEKQENETRSYQKLKFLNESDDYLQRLQEENQQKLFEKFLQKKGLLRKVKQNEDKKSIKNQDYFPFEQQILAPKDAELFTYLRRRNCIDANALYTSKQESSSSESSRSKMQSRQHKRQPLCQQQFKAQNHSDESNSADISLQSVYEYYLDDLYSEQRKLESKLSFQQTFNADLDKQLKTVNKIKTIHNKAIDCSLHKLFEST